MNTQRHAPGDDILIRDTALYDALAPTASGMDTAKPKLARLLANGDTDAKLADLEAEFDAAGGRGPDLADEIDRLRLKLHPEDYPELVAAAAQAAADEFDPMYQGAEAEDRHEAGEDEDYPGADDEDRHEAGEL